MKCSKSILLVFIFATILNISFISGQRTEVRGALVTTHFSSFEELKKAIEIKYITTPTGKTSAYLTHNSNGKTVTSLLKSGVSEIDFLAARDGGFIDKLSLLFKFPKVILKKEELKSVENFSRVKSYIFGEGDVAFYNIAKRIIANIDDDCLPLLNERDLISEKGYLNTINHIVAQAFMTTIFSEELADLVADAHERKNLPELIDGKFSKEQILNLQTGPVDNYVDMINNEWGQELGKQLKKKYQIHQKTFWSPQLLANYINDLQRYFSWAFEINFKPFKPEDKIIKRFSYKLNKVLQIH